MHQWDNIDWEAIKRVVELEKNKKIEVISEQEMYFTKLKMHVKIMLIKNIYNQYQKIEI